MPRRPGGLDPAEIDEALAALNAVTSPEELEDALDRLPALGTPMLHSILRQHYLELRNAKSPRLANFEARYEDLFSLLHHRWHLRLVKERRAKYSESGTGVAAAGTPEPFAPPFWLALLRALGDRLPADEGPFHDPAEEATDLRDELVAIAGSDVVLPDYEPTPGTRWSAVKVGCAACGRPRLDLRAYVVDLVIAPGLTAPLREAEINNSRCAGCGEVLSYPIRVWVMEAPGPGDPLATLTCVWRLAPDVFSYQPPPGTPREEENDRILEVRFQRLFHAVQWPEPEALASREGPVGTTISVSYSVDELVHKLDRVSGEPGDIPFAMATMVEDMTRKVESRVLPLHKAMDAVLRDAELIGGDWPVVHPGLPRQWEGRPLAHLFQSLVAEGVLRARSAEADALAMFACTTASSLLALGEPALAESALARAEDCLARAPAGRGKDLAGLAVADTRADVLESLGRHEEAEAIRQELRAAPELQRDDLGARFAQQGLASQEALGLFRRDQIGEALEAFEQCIAGWEALLEEVTAAGDGADPATAESRAAFARAARQSLSGALANLAAVLMVLIDDTVVVQIASAPDLSEEERRAMMLRAHPDPALAMARVDDALPALERMFDGEPNRGRLVRTAEGLLRRALELSEQVESWQFAGIQAHRLAVLYNELEDPATAEQYAGRAVRYAARAGDHERVWTALAFLAERELQRGNGPAALEHLETSARHRIRHEVGLGHHTGLLEATGALGHGAFRAVAAGGDPLQAVMIVESLRAANTAASLVTGTPFQPVDGDVSQAIARLASERESLRLHLTWSPGDEAVQQRLGAVEAELEREREALSLRDPRYGRWVDATDVDVASPDALTRRLDRLGPNSFWLGALTIGDLVWTYAADRNGAVVESAAMPNLVALDDDVPDGSSWTAQALARLADALLAPHAGRIEALSADDTVVISVAGSLQHIPFAALPWAGKRLCERATIVMVQGFGMFEAALDRPDLAFESFALIGAPKRPDLEPLHGAAAEIDAIGGFLEATGRRVDVSAGARATVKALVDAAASHDAIHIASHALADPSPERASRLMLSPDMVHGDSGDLSEDRIITGIEVRAGGFMNLAGCATGRTRDTGAPLLGGLVPAFLLAGARSVAATLWPIADQPAATFQEELYRQIVGGARPAAALAAAQRRCISGDLGETMRAATVWAAYAVYGAG